MYESTDKLVGKGKGERGRRKGVRGKKEEAVSYSDLTKAVMFLIYMPLVFCLCFLSVVLNRMIVSFVFWSLPPFPRS